MKPRRIAVWRWVVALAGLFAGSVLFIAVVVVIIGALAVLLLAITSQGVIACLFFQECNTGS